MTDKDIIKALQMCHLQGVTSECKGCFYRECDNDCIEDMQKDALDLINRQQAEIKWKTTYMHSLQLSMEEIKPQIKANAIKEFADRLKSEIKEEFDDCLCLTLYTVMDNLVKEMVGDDK